MAIVARGQGASKGRPLTMNYDEVKAFLSERKITDITTLTLDDILAYIRKGTMVGSTEKTAVYDAIEELVDCFYSDDMDGCYETLKLHGFFPNNRDIVDAKLLDIRMATIKLCIAIGHEIAKRGHTVTSIVKTDDDYVPEEE